MEELIKLRKVLEEVVKKKKDASIDLLTFLNNKLFRQPNSGEGDVDKDLEEIGGRREVEEKSNRDEATLSQIAFYDMINDY